jgi:predicted Zn-dependent peptidase
MNIKKFTLSNGLPVLHVPSPQANMSTVLYLSRAGSRYETAETNGLSRFYANMSLKKTEKYFAKLALAEAVDKIGAFFNLEINKEYTAFYIKSTNQYFDTALDVMAEIITRPVFDVNDISREKSYFNSEITNRGRDPNARAGDELYQLVFVDNPLSFSGIGDSRAVGSFNLDTLINFQSRFYNAANGLLVIVSPAADIEDKIESFFGGLLPGEAQTYQPLEYFGGTTQTKMINMEIDQNYFAIGMPAYPRASEEKYGQLLLNAIMGKTKSNTRLINIAATEALAYFIGCNIFLYSDTGLFTINFRSNQVNHKNAYNRVLEEIEKIVTNPIPDEELTKIKGYYHGTLDISLSDSIETAFFYGLQEFLEKQMISKEDYIEKLEATTGEQINKIAAAIFNQSQMFVVMVGKE